MKLFYLMDPMCSWCWGFQPVFQALIKRLPTTVHIQYVMGGLAPDSDEPMPPATREYVQSQWRAVEIKTGVSFNWDFWAQCHPRRSTYPACRAVIAAGMQSKTAIPNMIHAIQQAYYQQAKNPSDLETLITLAQEIQLDQNQFTQDMNSTKVEQLLQADFQLRQQLGVTGFPSLRLQTNETLKNIEVHYSDANEVLKQVI